MTHPHIPSLSAPVKIMKKHSVLAVLLDLTHGCHITHGSHLTHERHIPPTIWQFFSSTFGVISIHFDKHFPLEKRLRVKHHNRLNRLDWLKHKKVTNKQKPLFLLQKR